MTRPTFDAEAILAVTIASKPPGYFDGRMPMLRAYGECLTEHNDLLDQVRDATAAEDIPVMLDRLERANAVFERALDLAVALGILPAAAGAHIAQDLRACLPRLPDGRQ